MRCSWSSTSGTSFGFDEPLADRRGGSRLARGFGKAVHGTDAVGRFPTGRVDEGRLTPVSAAPADQLTEPAAPTPWSATRLVHDQSAPERVERSATTEWEPSGAPRPQWTHVGRPTIRDSDFATLCAHFVTTAPFGPGFVVKKANKSPVVRGFC